MQAELVVNPTDCPQRLPRLLLLGRYRQGQTIHNHVFPRNSISICFPKNPLRHLNSALRIFRNAVLIHGQTQHRRAVVRHQRKHGIQPLPFSVHGIHYRPSVHHPKAGPQYFRIHGIQLQRNVRHALHRLNHLWHQRHFVHARGAYINVQNLRTGFVLFHRQLLDVVHVAIPERLLQFLFARRIDSLPDDIQLSIFRHRTGGAYAIPGFRNPSCRIVMAAFMG